MTNRIIFARMQIVTKYFPELTPGQQQQFAALEELYRYWNARINVISRKDLDNLYERHVLHSLGISGVVAFRKGTSVLDAGTGGGFPGIPLAIMFPDSEFLLVDSVTKKIKVVNEIVTELGLQNVEAYPTRIENIGRSFDFIVSRAVTALPVFLKWCNGKIKKKGFNDLPNGILYLKGGDLTDELSAVSRRINIYPLSRYFKEPFFETKKVVHIW